MFKIWMRKKEEFEISSYTEERAKESSKKEESNREEIKLIFRLFDLRKIYINLRKILKFLLTLIIELKKNENFE